jgi:hypothetical protein
MPSKVRMLEQDKLARLFVEVCGFEFNWSLLAMG